MRELFFRKILFSLLLCLSLFFYSPISNAEENLSSKRLDYIIETNASFSGSEYTPFWLVNNRQGLGSPKLNNGYARVGMVKPMNHNSKFDWGASANLSAGWNIPAPLAIRELYAELHYRKFWVSIGAKDFQSGYNNRYLSSGNLLFSGNAMAIPQVRIGTDGFAPFWGTRGWFSVNLYLSYGLFTDSKWQKSWVYPGGNRTSDVLFCGRGLWIRGGNTEKFPLTLDVGIQMATQFGGTIYNDGKIIKMPTAFRDWMKAIIPLSGNDDTPVEEQTNIQGNMTGEYNISLNFSPIKTWNFRVYWEHYFEDQSQMTFEYGTWKDGLWGIEISFPKNPVISTIVYENVYTKDQTGAINHDWTPEIPEQVSGGDNYFNHYLYGSWQTWGMSIGTPLAISPLYNKNHTIYIYDTRFIANHIGIEGNPIEGLKWRTLLTFSQNWGTYRFPYKEILNNFSGIVEVTYSPVRFKGWFAKGALAWDSGKLLGNNFGVLLSVGKTGLIKW